MMDEHCRSHEPQPATFGATLRARCLARRLSLRRFAQHVGISPTYLSRIETGALGPPAAARLVRMAEVLNEPPDALFALAGRVPSDVDGIIRERPLALATFLRVARRLSPAQLDQLIDHARQLGQVNGRNPG